MKSVNEYFQLDYTDPYEKYEYLDGVIRLMSGESGEHSEIAYHMRTALNQNFRTGPCFVRSSDLRVQVSASRYFYPDVTVSCDVADRKRGNKLIRSPRIVVEVLSPSTEKVDRTDKLSAYQTCPSIQEVVLISQFAPYVEIYRRDREKSDEWHHGFYEAGQELLLESVDVHFPLEDLYRGINFDEPLIEE
ncbi:MAG TPA: Uma2 family endonuclease [Ktedonobacteraceae bacterium]|nr:Uma2 family endonuclease [Ktedonobacteraceae bacterium]